VKIEENMDLNQVTEKIIGCAYKVSNGLGSGFLEKVYENALAYELRKDGMHVLQQHPMQVQYDGVVVGEYYADLLVEDCVMVELKTVKALDDLRLDEIHMAQCLNYLKATGLHLCLLINFYRPKAEIKRIVHRLEGTVDKAIRNEPLMAY
jgi:GxxExxY protein